MREKGEGKRRYKDKIVVINCTQTKGGRKNEGKERQRERQRDLLLSLIPMNIPSMTFPPTLQNILSFLDTSSEPLSAAALKRTAAVEHLQEYMYNDHSLL